MAMVNQAGDAVFEQSINYPSDFAEGELAQAVIALADHLKLLIVRTNATKHGNTELQLNPYNN